MVAPSKSSYRPRAAYAQSKLANVLHTFALARRLAGSRIAVNCLHPGVVRSGLLPPWLRTIKSLIPPEIVDVTRGARTTLYLALDEAAGALNRMYLDEHQQVRPAAPLARSVALQEALWAASTKWVEEASPRHRRRPRSSRRCPAAIEMVPSTGASRNCHRDRLGFAGLHRSSPTVSLQRPENRGTSQ